MMVLPDVLQGKPEGPILVFAPERIVMTQLARLTEDALRTTDLERQDVDYPGEDIQGLSFLDEQFSAIICNHVLEHVPEDERALLECSRVLKSGGVALFTVPGDFSRHETWYFDRPDDNGHYRHYGLDILGKMKKAFSLVEPINMGKIAPPEWRVREGDFVFVCRKLG
ncbi:MAG: class I SAM-dependent methyltransferase [Anaerolineae bacterium]